MAALLKKIVRNDAMKSDPNEIYGWRVYVLTLSACFGAMSFGWDSGVIGGVIELQTFADAYNLGDPDSVPTANLKGNIVSVLQAGCFAGALAAFYLADRIGRRWSLIGSALFTLSGVVMQAAASGHLEPMYIGRFISGLGVGCSSVVNPIYVSENAPRAIRGLLTSCYQLFIVLGGMISFWGNFAVNKHLSGHRQYIVPLAIQGLPALLLFSLMLISNESPRYLARMDKWEEAKRVLRRVRNLPETHPYLQDEYREIQTQLEHERRVMGDATFWILIKEMAQSASNRKRAALSITLMVCQQMTGTNAINTYAPTIFKNLGVVGQSNSLLSTGVYGIVKVISCLAFLLFMADSLGRRRSLLVSSVGQAFCMFYIGIYVRISPPVDGAAVPPAGYFALVCIFVFAAFFQFGWGPACWIYVAEIPTARLRPLNVALAAATQWLFNFVVARAVPNMLVTVGAHGYGTYLIFGSFCVCMFFFVFFFIPETKGVSLEHMDELFGGSKRNLAGAGAAADQDADPDHKSYEANVEVTEDKARRRSQDV
ncbi:MFS quinate transporter [Apiospora marii]|uniref:MFS quinate transporter n=1 Tax=Apiospora marii TaxID=335849 RepID=UPI0031317A3A